jgi:hypothetical protein
MVFRRSGPLHSSRGRVYITSAAILLLYMTSLSHAEAYILFKKTHSVRIGTVVVARKFEENNVCIIYDVSYLHPTPTHSK